MGEEGRWQKDTVRDIERINQPENYDEDWNCRGTLPTSFRHSLIKSNGNGGLFVRHSFACLNQQQTVYCSLRQKWALLLLLLLLLLLGGNGTQGISRAPRWLLNIVGIELWFKGNIIRNLC